MPPRIKNKQNELLAQQTTEIVRALRAPPSASKIMTFSLAEVEELVRCALCPAQA